MISCWRRASNPNYLCIPCGREATLCGLTNFVARQSEGMTLPIEFFIEVAWMALSRLHKTKVRGKGYDHQQQLYSFLFILVHNSIFVEISRSGSTPDTKQFDTKSPLYRFAHELIVSRSNIPSDLPSWHPSLKVQVRFLNTHNNRLLVTLDQKS
ncbi:hypothetical protein ElyMa_005463100 [Elysia marginata]|uniref:Uncharacterized protein n=1 Tax=Elysia marginata TaxID=1093978 RepID=A0AAV4EQ00_9GAST|nr:hypothetical protein ElyMa_005463100 [Elysia marginata]